jgi:hypothetical protein
MKKFNVECKTNRFEIPDNYVGDFVEAADEAEAIEFAMDYLADQAIQTLNVTDIRRSSDELVITYLDETGAEITETAFNFTAVEA